MRLLRAWTRRHRYQRSKLALPATGEKHPLVRSDTLTAGLVPKTVLSYSPLAICRLGLLEKATLGGGGRQTEGAIDGRVDQSCDPPHTTLRQVVWAAKGSNRCCT